MEDEKTPVAAAGEQTWQRVVATVLQFVGGGLVALHEQDSPVKAPGPEDADERDIRERLAGLGIRTDHADTIRRSWTSPASPAPNVQAGSIPTMSFEEFAAAVSQLDAAGDNPAPAQGANAPGTAGVQQAEPPRPEPPPRSDAGGGRRRPPEPRDEYMEMRLSALETKLQELQLLLMTQAASAPASVSAAPTPDRSVTPSAAGLDASPSAAPTSDSIVTPSAGAIRLSASSETPRCDGAARHDERAPTTSSSPESSSPQYTTGPVASPNAPDAVGDRGEVEGESASLAALGKTGDARSVAQGADVERETVVQGPWTSERASAGDGAAAISPEDPGGVYDAHERRVAALERTFESFGSMVEGLAARSRGKGPPSE